MGTGTSVGAPVLVGDAERAIYAVVRNDSTLPFSTGQNLRLDIDRSAATVTIIYDDGASTVREVWRIEGSVLGAR